MVWWSLNNHFLLFLQLWSQNPGPSCAGHDLSFPEWQVPDPSAYPSNWARSCQDCWCSSLQVGSNLSVPPSPRAQVQFYYPILKIRQFLAPCCSPENQLPGVAFKAPCSLTSGTFPLLSNAHHGEPLAPRLTAIHSCATGGSTSLYFSCSTHHAYTPGIPFRLLPHLYSFLATHTSFLRITFSGKLSMTYFLSLFKLIGLSLIFLNFLQGASQKSSCVLVFNVSSFTWSL